MRHGRTSHEFETKQERERQRAQTLSGTDSQCTTRLLPKGRWVGGMCGNSHEDADRFPSARAIAIPPSKDAASLVGRSAFADLRHVRESANNRI